MFALIRDELALLPSTITLDGYTYTDLTTSSKSALENIGIFLLPDPPAYDKFSQKLEVNKSNLTWEILDLSEEEKEKVISAEYLKFYNKNYAKYLNYEKLRDNNTNNTLLTLQLENYLISLSNYCNKILLQETPLTELREYPEPLLTSYTSSI